jgi:YD repeat-containing protein
MAAGLGLSLFFTACRTDEPLPKKPTKPPVTNTPGNNSGNGSGNGNEQPPTGTPGQQPPAVPGNKLSQMGTKRFAYDAQGRLSRMEYRNELYLGYEVVYKGDKAVRLNFKSGGYLVYTYEGDRVTGAVRYYGENLVNYRYQFRYEGDKLVKESQISYARSDEGQLTVYQYSYDERGNLVQIAAAGTNGTDEGTLPAPSYITYGAYDNLENPAPHAESDIYLPGVKLFRNNPGYRESSGYRELYSYAYGENKLPKERYEKLNTHPHVPAMVTSYQYQ